MLRPTLDALNEYVLMAITITIYNSMITNTLLTSCYVLPNIPLGGERYKTLIPV